MINDQNFWTLYHATKKKSVRNKKNGKEFEILAYKNERKKIHKTTKFR